MMSNTTHANPTNASKLWGGMFETAPLAVFHRFNQSLPFDWQLWPFDILGSIAHVRMLGKQGHLSEADVTTLVEGLETLYADLEYQRLPIATADDEDVHSFVERILTERLGTVAKNIHMGRSRNDQVALDFKLFCRHRLDVMTHAVAELIHALCDKAAPHTHTLMPGFTHLQAAQPISFAHHLMAYTEMFRRDVERLQAARQRLNLSPLGAGALATTTFNLDRAFVANELGFAGVTRNSLDTVSDRDFALDTLHALTMVMMHLSRLSEELIVWNSQAYGFVTLPDSLTTGSSMMPQKRNPDGAELIRGKTGRVFGAFTSLFTTMKALPLAYNKDTQEDKEPVFDAITTVQGCLTIMTLMIQELEPNVERLKQATGQGYTNATDVADALTKAGMPFREAHEWTGKLVRHAMGLNVSLEAMPLETWQAVCPAVTPEVLEAIPLDRCMQRRAVVGGPAPEQVSAHIKETQQWLQTLPTYSV
ncbi:MAG: argininosuccinate lyase [Vampirovibrionales bacterium]